MGLFDRFPYSNFHELNLSWILEMLQQIDKTMDEFVAINALKYADPIQWDITRQYEKNTIVIDPITGTAYISVQPVPMGVILSNTDYWSVVFDLGSFVTRTAKNFTNRYEAETTLTATFNSSAGDWLVWGDTLYTAMSNINIGDAYVVDSNLKHLTMEELAIFLNNNIGMLNTLNTTDKSSAVAAINEVLSNLGAITLLNTTDKSSAVAAINEVLSSLGDITTLNTTDKSSAVAAINEVLSDVGDLSSLATTDQSSTVAAINEVLSDVGDLSSLATTDQSSTVAAINELDGYIDNVYGVVQNYNRLFNKKILLIGDSLSDEAFYAGNNKTCWVTPFRSKIAGIATLDNKSSAGRKMIDLPGNIGNFYTSDDDYDIIIIQLGTNDSYGASPTPLQPYSFGTYDPAKFQGAIVFTYMQLMAVNSSKIPEIWFITPPMQTLENHNAAGTTTDYYRKAIEGFCHGNNCMFIDGGSIPIISASPVLSKIKNEFQYDGIHFESSYADILCDYILMNLVAGGNNAATASDGYQMDFGSYMDLTGGIGGTVDGTGTVTMNCYITGTATSGTVQVANSLPDGVFTMRGGSAFRLPVTIYDSTNDTCRCGLLYMAGSTMYLKIYDFTTNFDFSIFGDYTFKSSSLIYDRSLT